MFMYNLAKFQKNNKNKIENKYSTSTYVKNVGLEPIIYD